MANQTAANTKTAAAMVREEDLTDLQNLQREIEDRIGEARQNGRLYMMQQYVRLLAGVTSETKKISARFERERLAGHNNELKALKAERKAAADGATPTA